MNRITGISPLGVSQRRRSLIYLLRVEFATDDPAPIANPYVGEVGSLTVLDPDSILSVSGGEILPSGINSTANRPRLYTPQYNRAQGLALLCKWKHSTSQWSWVGWSNGNMTTITHTTIYGVVFGATDGVIFSNSLTERTGMTANTYSNAVIVLCDVGFYVIVDNSLRWVGNTGSETPMQAAISARNTTGFIPFTSDYFRVAQLGSPFNISYGIATNRVASPVVDTTTTSEANALVEMTWQAVTGQTWELSTRRTDDDNRWIVRCDQAGSTIKLIERNGGVETERSSAAQTWTNGTQYRLVVIQDGNTIRTYVANTAKNTYTSASFNNTATGVKTDKAGSNLVTYPRTLSGAALTELQRWTS